MAGQPKNKITRAERGKRRHGNTPKLMKDTTVSRTPLHKQAYVRKLVEKFGSSALKADSKATVAKSSEKKKEGKAAVAVHPMAETSKPMTTKAPTVKKTTRTQHKGG